MKQITINLPGNISYTVDQFTPVSQFFTDKNIVAAKKNNKTVSLNSRIKVNCDLEPIYLNTSDGSRIYRRSLSMILAMASKRVFPHRKLKIGHSLGHSFYYYYESTPINEEDLCSLKEEMNTIVSMNIPMEEDYSSWKDAVNYFTQKGFHDTALLLEFLNNDTVKTVRTGDHIELCHEPMAKCTGQITVFNLTIKEKGFLLHFPPTHTPDKLEPLPDRDVIFNIYKEYKKWGKIQGVHTVAHINQLSREKKSRHFIRIAESLQNKKITEIADLILKKKKEIRVILIAGPSSSGKTTFAKKLSLALEVNGIKPLSISLDDYYLPHSEVPVDEHGELDLEAMEALNVKLLNENLKDLCEGKETWIPINDFKTGTRTEKGRKLILHKNNVLIMEGIHGLNDNLTPSLPDESKFKIYISALTQLNLDDNNRISTTDNRFLRRLVRDYNFRRYSAAETFRIWPSVNRGERKNIFPFQGTAHTAFNSALDYEISVLKVYAEPLLKDIKPDSPYYNEAVRLLQLLNNFIQIPAEMVPSESILREFIGNSDFKY